jgi:TAZ zinc finger
MSASSHSNDNDGVVPDPVLPESMMNDCDTVNDRQQHRLVNQQRYSSSDMDTIRQCNKSTNSTSSESNSSNSSSIHRQMKVDKIKIKRLLLLRHAAHCTTPNGTNCPTTRHCGEMKRLYHHIQDGCHDNQCTVSHCVSSRYILAHFYNCHDGHCSCCTPVRMTLAETARASAAATKAKVTAAKT